MNFFVSKKLPPECRNINKYSIICRYTQASANVIMKLQNLKSRGIVSAALKGYNNPEYEYFVSLFGGFIK